MHAHRWAVLLLLLLGCTLEDGRGFGRLEATLETRFAGLEESGRFAEGGWYRTDSSFELRIATLELEVGRVRLQGPAESGGTAATGGDCAFDPAEPPAGCTLCHGGHCHCEGGELVSYEELEARVCGGTEEAAESTLAVLAAAGPQDLLLPAAPSRLACQGSCEVGRGAISSVALELTRLTIRAAVRDRSLEDRLGGEEPALEVDLVLGGAELEGALETQAALDRDHPYHVRLALELEVTSSLFDDLAWDTLERPEGVIDVDGTANHDAGKVLLANLAEAELRVTVTRSDD